MVYSLIVAAANHYVIGRNNQLPWHLPRDLRYFKTVTTGHIVIMGRKTYESMGKALPNRSNIVISRQAAYQLTDATCCPDLPSALDLAKTLLSDPLLSLSHEEIFIIGGATIFTEAWALVDRVYVNRVLADITGDTYFPALTDLNNTQTWQLSQQEFFAADEKNAHDLRFEVYNRHQLS